MVENLEKPDPMCAKRPYIPLLKSWSIREHLSCRSCKCRNKIVDKLVEECSENIDGNEMLYNETFNTIPLKAISLDAKACNSCTMNIVLLVIFFIITIYISSVSIYFPWHLKNIVFVFNPSTQTTIYWMQFH